MPQPRDRLHSIDGRLFQAAMWRQFAAHCNDDTQYGYWLRRVLEVSRTECLRRARVNIYLARRLNRTIER